MGVEGFRFWGLSGASAGVGRQEKPTSYDMRLVRHEDGWVYGLSCAERHDVFRTARSLRRHRALRHRPHQGFSDAAAPPDREYPALHQRNCVLHPEFVKGRYAFYTRPMADFGRRHG